MFIHTLCVICVVVSPEMLIHTVCIVRVVVISSICIQ